MSARSDALYSIECELEISAGMVRGGREQWFRLTISDEVSRAFVAEVNLSPDQFMSLIGGGMMTVKGELATPSLAKRFGHVPVHEKILVPEEVIGRLYGDKAKLAAIDWYEDQPGSGMVDHYHADNDRGERFSTTWVIRTTTYVPKDIYDREMALTEESEEPDMDDDGLDDDDDG